MTYVIVISYEKLATRCEMDERHHKRELFAMAMVPRVRQRPCGRFDEASPSPPNKRSESHQSWTPRGNIYTIYFRGVAKV